MAFVFLTSPAELDYQTVLDEVDPGQWQEGDLGPVQILPPEA